jgi:hypothetical protein
MPMGAPGVPLAAAPPTQTFRLGLYTNDLRNGNWHPTSPTLLCGGKQDPTVFYDVNTSTMAKFWSAEVSAGLITVLDVNAAPTANDPFALIQGGFIASQPSVQNYHGAVAPFCALAARSFFANF